VSTVGVSHLSKDIPCQDSSKATQVVTPKGEHIILVASDGCGSAQYSEVGSNLIVSEVTECIAYWIQRSQAPHNLLDIIVFALGHAHQKLAQKASDKRIPINELAATCMCLVAGSKGFAAAQIGDGVIIGGTEDVFGCLFWPSQEYANVTDSLTDKRWYQHLQVTAHQSNNMQPNSWFLATDGIQAICCDYQKRTPHVGFVSAIISKFRNIDCESEQVMVESLDKFLRSEKINSAVSDDKTIVLACRKWQ